MISFHNKVLGRKTTMLLRCIVLLISLSQIIAAESWNKPGCLVVGHSRTVNIPNCIGFKITTNACRGFCESWSLPSIMLGFKRHPVTSFGQCCNIMDSEDVPVEVNCTDENENIYKRKLLFKSALSCGCYHCQKD